jgi:Tol biopolymer transport system component
LVALDRAPSRVESPPRPLWQLTYDPGLQHDPTWSPDGRRVAYTSDRAGNSDIWVQALADPTPIRVTSSSAHEWQPDWSPDGRWLAFRSERDGGGLYVISPRGGAERRVAEFGYRPRWSPDGSRILFSNSGLHLNVPPRMYVVGLNGQAPRPVRSDLLAEFREVSVGWHPDGAHVSIWGRHRQTGWTFLTAPVAGGPASRWTLSPEVERQLDAAATTLTRFVWSSSAQYLYFEGLSENVRNIWRVTVDPHTMAWIAGPERLTTGVGDDSGIALSPDGTKLVFSIQSANTRLWAFPFDAASGKLTGPGEPVTSGAMDVLNFDAPADSTRFVYRTIRAGQHELWERSIDNGRERLLIGDHEWARVGPTWSADGQRLAYQRGRRSSDGRWVEQAVAVLPASGGAEELLTTPGRLGMVPTDWSRDGSLILGACWTAEQRSGVCVLPVASAPHAERHVRLVTSKPRWDLYEQRFSPDQRRISFNAVDATDASVSAIHVVPASGGPWTAITDGRSFDDVPRWAPDGRAVYFVSNRGGFLNVWGRRFDPAAGRPIGPPFQVTSFDGPREMLLPRMGNIKLVVSSNRLLVPVVETAGRIWILDNVDR